MVVLTRRRTVLLRIIAALGGAGLVIAIVAINNRQKPLHVGGYSKASEWPTPTTRSSIKPQPTPRMEMALSQPAPGRGRLSATEESSIRASFQVNMQAINREMQITQDEIESGQDRTDAAYVKMAEFLLYRAKYEAALRHLSTGSYEIRNGVGDLRELPDKTYLSIAQGSEYVVFTFERGADLDVFGPSDQLERSHNVRKEVEADEFNRLPDGERARRINDDAAARKELADLRSELPMSGDARARTAPEVIAEHEKRVAAVRKRLLPTYFKVVPVTSTVMVRRILVR